MMGNADTPSKCQSFCSAGRSTLYQEDAEDRDFQEKVNIFLRAATMDTYIQNLHYCGQEIHCYDGVPRLSRLTLGNSRP